MRKNYKCENPNGYKYLLSITDKTNNASSCCVLLSGAGERGDLKGAISSFTRIIPDKDWDKDIVYIIPECSSDDIWRPDKIKEIIDDKSGIYFDINCVVVSGYSLGGRGTFDVICDYPELFKAAAPIASFSAYLRAEQMRNIPIMAIHAINDDCVPIAETCKTMNVLNRIGHKDNLFITEPFSGHGIFVDAYEKYGIIDWMLAYAKNIS